LHNIPTIFTLLEADVVVLGHASCSLHRSLPDIRLLRIVATRGQVKLVTFCVIGSVWRLPRNRAAADSCGFEPSSGPRLASKNATRLKASLGISAYVLRSLSVVVVRPRFRWFET
jgi:hypothetical protein